METDAAATERSNDLLRAARAQRLIGVSASTIVVAEHDPDELDKTLYADTIPGITSPRAHLEAMEASLRRMQTEGPEANPDRAIFVASYTIERHAAGEKLRPSELFGVDTLIREGLVADAEANLAAAEISHARDELGRRQPGAWVLAGMAGAAAGALVGIGIGHITSGSQSAKPSARQPGGAEKAATPQPAISVDPGVKVKASRNADGSTTITTEQSGRSGNGVNNDFKLAPHEAELNARAYRPIVDYAHSKHAVITNLEVIGQASDENGVPGCGLGKPDRPNRQLASLRAQMALEEASAYAKQQGVDITTGNLYGQEVILTPQAVRLVDRMAHTLHISRCTLLLDYNHDGAKLAGHPKIIEVLDTLFSDNRGTIYRARLSVPSAPEPATSQPPAPISRNESTASTDLTAPIGIGAAAVSGLFAGFLARRRPNPDIRLAQRRARRKVSRARTSGVKAASKRTSV